jgi:hypothetical protein
MYQDMMEWMIRILDGEMAGASDEDLGSKVGQMWLNLAPKPKPQIQLSMIQMGQMILSEPSIIIV